MSTFDALQLETARACLDELGDSSQVTITRATPGALNTATGLRAETTTTATMTAIVSRIGGRGDPKVRRVKFTVLAEDCLDSGAALFRPDENDRVAWDGVTWHVELVEARCGDQIYDLSCADVGTLTAQ
jgi:hypothetical protein